MSNNKKQSAGFTLIEMLVAAAILGIVISAATTLFGSLSNSLDKTRVLAQRDRQINSLISTVAANVSLFQADFSGSITGTLDVANLPGAWSDTDVIFDKNTCGTSCPEGRFGLVIQPIGGANKLPGLFKVTLRLTHPKLFSGFRNYNFVMSGR